MFKINKMIFIIILSISMLISIPLICYGNSAEPPSILIIVPDAPDNLEISIGSNNEYKKANKINKVIEMYYTFYSDDLSNTKSYNIKSYNIKIDLEDETFEMPLSEPLKTYNNIFILDLKNQTLTHGKSLSRSFTLVVLRIILTVVIEGLVFFLFGYRQKKSWNTFLTINLLTQGALNIWINGFSPLTSYIVLSLIFGEFLVFIVEVFVFSSFIKEHSAVRTTLYVLLANLLSLIAGGYIITILPI